MAERASKKTTLTLGAVSIEVGLFKTTGEPPQPAFPFVDASPKGNELEWKIEAASAAPPRPAKVSADPLAAALSIPDPGPRVPEEWLEDSVTGDRVEADQIRKGIRREGEFIDLTDHLEEIERVSRLEEMNVVAFVDTRRVPRERVIGSYWLVPAAASGNKALGLILHGLKETNRSALVKWTKTKNQALGVITPHRSGALLVQELAFFSAVRAPSERALAPAAETFNEDQKQIIVDLVRGRSDVPVAIDEMEDDALVARIKLVEEAARGEIEAPAPMKTLVDEDFLVAFANSVEGS